MLRARVRDRGRALDQSHGRSLNVSPATAHRARDRRRPLAPRLRRVAPRRTSDDGDRLSRTGTRLLRQARDHSQTSDDRQHLQLRQESLTRRAARRPQHPPPDHRALPAAHQRQGRALPPDNGTRVGLRPRLPLTPTTKPGSATLARALQQKQTTQLPRSETDPRSAAFTTSAGRTATYSGYARPF